MGFDLYHWVISGESFVRQVQQYRTPLLDAYFRFATFLGEEQFYLALLAIIYWTVNKQFGRRLTYVLIGSAYLNTFVKDLLRLPRPPEALHLVEQGGYGLPSGHTMNGSAVWGYVAWQWKSGGLWRWLIPAVIMASLAMSRIYLGVHYPADVLAGLLLAAVWVALWLFAEARLADWIGRLRGSQVFWLSLAFSLLLLFLHPGDEADYPAPAAVSLSALIFGLNVGFFYERARVRFSLSATWLQRLGRILVGSLFIGVFWLGLRMLFGLVDVGVVGAVILRYVRYALTGFALTWWAPAAFVRLGLAGVDKEAGSVRVAGQSITQNS